MDKRWHARELQATMLKAIARKGFLKTFLIW